MYTRTGTVVRGRSLTVVTHSSANSDGQVSAVALPALSGVAIVKTAGGGRRRRSKGKGLSSLALS